MNYPDTDQAAWISESLEREAVNGRRHGYTEAQLLVAEIVNEFYEADDQASARLIHEEVWRRLEAERDARLNREP